MRFHSNTSEGKRSVGTVTRPPRWIRLRSTCRLRPSQYTLQSINRGGITEKFIWQDERALGTKNNYYAQTIVDFFRDTFNNIKKKPVNQISSVSLLLLLSLLMSYGTTTFGRANNMSALLGRNSAVLFSRALDVKTVAAQTSDLYSQEIRS